MARQSDRSAQDDPAERVQRETLELVERVRARIGEFTARVVADLEGRAPELVRGDPEVLEALRRMSVANFEFGLAGVRELAQGRPPEWSSDEPAGAAEHARFMARLGAPLEVLLRAYRVAHSVGWDMTVEEITAIGLVEPLQSMMLTGASHFQFEYFDHLISVVTEAYTREFESRTRGREQRRVRVVSRVLAGEAASSDELEYRLEGHHLAMVVRGTEAESAARALAGAIGREALVVSHSDELAWVWLGSRDGFADGIWETLCTHPRPAGVTIAAGESHSAIEGFRLSHLQAQMADRAAGVCGRGPLTRYADVALLAGVLEHDSSGESFVGMVLGELAGPGRRCAALRETLAAYFAAGQNARSAAASLGVGERTVRYRLRTIEQMLGHPVDARRPALEVALQLTQAPPTIPPDS